MQMCSTGREFTGHDNFLILPVIWGGEQHLSVSYYTSPAEGRLRCECMCGSTGEQHGSCRFQPPWQRWETYDLVPATVPSRPLGMAMKLLPGQAASKQQPKSVCC